MDIEALRQAAREWVAVDPDPHTRDEVAAMLDAGDEAALREHFGVTLDFGTGGMRGTMGPGTNRMNRLMVRRVTAALAIHLERTRPDARERGVAVAFDGRRHSATYAQDAARVLAGRGFRVHLARRVVPTPVLSFATVELGAAAGVIVTASHNPPDDNGYKVFWDRGAQIVPPVDVAIQAELAALSGQAIHTPPVEEIAHLVMPWPDAVLDAYFARIAALRVHPDARGARVVYTPLHGVGGAFALRALAEAGHDDVHVVADQADPDETFPTVDFPNPEERGVLDRALALARKVDADLVLANDPDADRVAVAVPDSRGGWRQLTGNEVGVLLAEDLLAARPVGEDDLVVTTIVSTTMLRRVAASHGVRSAEVLTGFKWIADAAFRHEAEGGRFLYGFEESIGYSAGTVVRDKDGVSTALLLADLVAHLKAEGRSLIDLLEELYRRHGLHVGRQRSVRLPGVEGAARIRAAMRALREGPPTALAGLDVTRVLDLDAGRGRDADGTTFDLGLPRADVVACELVGGSRALVRPSGTEPKIKLYFEVVEALHGGPLAEAEARAAARLDRMEVELLARLGLG